MTGDYGVGALCATAAALGLVHTLLGPDHYVPFVALARAGRWSLVKTALVTLLCGVGHVLGSVVLGLIGVGVGVSLLGLESIEAARGRIAGWILLAFGLVYLAWGIRRAVRNRPHSHAHIHADGTRHSHTHSHTRDHAHVHAPPLSPLEDGAGSAKQRSATAAWVLFIVFVFGPCEPLIPLLMFPAAAGDAWGVAVVATVFGLVTIATMLTVVLLMTLGVSRVNLGRYQRYGHALAGSLVVGCGAAILLGL